MDNILVDAHASKGPSAADTWVPCAAAPRLQAMCANLPTEFAELGSAAHELLEVCFKTNTDAEDHRGEMFNIGNPIQAEGFEADDDMILAVQVALDAVRALLKSLVHLEPLFYSERKVDPGQLIDGRTDMWGTGDITVIAGNTLYAWDYKHGQGVLVEVTNKFQNLLYAIGCYADLPLERQLQIQYINLGIIQPRAPHKDGPVRTQIIPMTDLPGWIEFFRKAVTATDDPNATTNPGIKQCRFCDAKPCEGMTDSVAEVLNLETVPSSVVTPEQGSQLSMQIETAVSIDTALISSSQRIAWLDNASLIRAMLDGVEAQSQHMLKDGTAPPELKSTYKLVNKATKRKFSISDPAALAKKLQGMGFKKPEITTEKVVSPAAVEKLAKAKKFSERKMKNLYGLIVKPEGGLTIAPASDPRPAAQETTAEEMFGAPVGEGET